jgi:prevent-host-death family protein
MGDVLERASVLKERVVLTRGGKRVAVVVPVEDLALLEALEDRLDLGDRAGAGWRSATAWRCCGRRLAT